MYAFHSLMEWYQSRGQQANSGDTALGIVKKIFELGLSQSHVQSQPEYVNAFAKWLVSAARARCVRLVLLNVLH